MNISLQLACQIGLNESIVLSVLHQVLQDEETEWVMLTYDQWQQLMPFWSLSTVRRIIRRLEQLGYIEAANRNRNKIDQTKSYRICYEELQKQNIVLNNQYEKLELRKQPKEPLAFLAVQNGKQSERDEQRTTDDGQTVAGHTFGYIDQPAVHHREAMSHNGQGSSMLGDHVQKAAQPLVVQRNLPTQAVVTNTSLAHSLDQIEQTMLLKNNVLNKQSEIYHLSLQDNYEKQEEKKKIWSFYQQYHFYPNNHYVQKRIVDWIEKTNAPLVLEALKTALEYGSTSWKYAESVLYDWQAKQYETVEDVEKAKRRKRRRSVPQKRPPIRRELLPDWFEDYKKQWETPTTPEPPIDKEALRERLQKYR
ncbi:DnaD/phage-associated family protein [Anoxybacillus voinovskiensis]|uniref:DnaD/phage-associated family protein n=1 Tax=Anoxybacteroides voinovskiense TaxID=230470 RepID=A0A840DQL7_9BACL|nr:DnaD domain protein [Anoxybacillus voinovskiensis]MBB4072447.1 DnaD/phage-associated family protein [Anoxybacillus voinovskiensis]GGJ57772.1 hypothetical protein GCM10008982_03660 [Anoxybacillus voinovskiensis]